MIQHLPVHRLYHDKYIVTIVGVYFGLMFMFQLAFSRVSHFQAWMEEKMTSPGFCSSGLHADVNYRYQPLYSCPDTAAQTLECEKYSPGTKTAL